MLNLPGNMPGKINKDIDEMNSKSGKVLYRTMFFILIVVALFAYRQIIMRQDDCSQRCDKLERQNIDLSNKLDSIKTQYLTLLVLDNEAGKKRIHTQDSIKAVGRSAIKKSKR